MFLLCFQDVLKCTVPSFDGILPKYVSRSQTVFREPLARITTLILVFSAALGELTSAAVHKDCSSLPL